MEKTTNLTAEEMLESNPDIKALLKTRSELNSCINVSTKLITLLIKHIDTSSMHSGSLEKLTQLFEEYKKTVIQIDPEIVPLLNPV